MNDSFEFTAAMFALVACVLIVVLPVVYGVAEMRLEKKCFALGYPSSRMDYAFNGYCVAREDQTDRVVPLAEAGRR